MKNTLNDEKSKVCFVLLFRSFCLTFAGKKGKISDEDKKSVQSAIDETAAWLDEVEPVLSVVLFRVSTSVCLSGWRRGLN